MKARCPNACNSGENISGERRGEKEVPNCTRGLQERLPPTSAYLPAHLTWVQAPQPFAVTVCRCQAPLIKVVDICTQIAKMGNTMGLFPLSSPSPWDLCTVCHLAQHGLPWITGRPKPALSGATAKSQKYKWLCPLQAWNLFTLNLCRTWLGGVKSEWDKVQFIMVLFCMQGLSSGTLCYQKLVTNRYETPLKC